MKRSRRSFAAKAAARLSFPIVSLSVLLTLAPVPGAASEEGALFRIGTGGTGGTYYPIGSMIAAKLTDRLGIACTEGCPEQRLLAVAQTSNGSVSNARELGAGGLEAGLVQADIAYWAYRGKGVFAGSTPLQNLRAVGRLYPESLHIVARAGAGIASLADLRGKRVSLDEQGSGTLVAARRVLDAHGLSETEVEPVYIKPDLAVQRIRAGTLDAFFAFAGVPVASIDALAEEVPITLVPIDAEAQARIVDLVPLFTPAVLPAGVYRGTAATPTLEVGALLLTRADLDEALIYRVTSALWHAETRIALAEGHARGALIRRDTALQGLPLPLHPGAERYYRDSGLLPP